MRINNFKDLKIWRLSLSITKEIYDLSGNNDFNRDFGLRNQIRRAAISISSNIVEGFEKNNNNEFIRYLKIAKGSAGEARNQLEIAKVVGYITEKELLTVDEKLIDLASQIGGFIKYLETKRKGNIKDKN